MPESVSWRSFCSYIRQLEDGADGLGPSFLDEVRTRWIRSMAYGMRTTARNRAAIQEYRGRVRKIWLSRDEESTPSVFDDNGHHDNEEGREDDAERNLAELAQLNLDLLHAEAAESELLGLKKDVADFLARTKAALQSFIPPDDVEANVHTAGFIICQFIISIIMPILVF